MMFKICLYLVGFFLCDINNSRLEFVNYNNFSLKDSIKIELLNNTCITGFLALNYWVSIAKESGFNTKYNTGFCKISDKNIEYSLPVDSHGISVYTDNIKETYDIIMKEFKCKEKRFYERFLSHR